MLQHPAAPYVAPFAVFFLLDFAAQAGLSAALSEWEYPFRCAALSASIWYFSRGVLSFKPKFWFGSIAVGLAVIVVWVGPDVLWPSYRQHWLFSNGLFKPKSSLPTEFRDNAMVLVFRTVRAVVLVPILEELFWRGWLQRWLIDVDFLKVPLGTFERNSFLIGSALFALEHGSYWEVALICGFAYNWWVTRTRTLADSMLAHAVSNAALSAYVIAGKHWQYW